MRRFHINRPCPITNLPCKEIIERAKLTFLILFHVDVASFQKWFNCNAVKAGTLLSTVYEDVLYIADPDGNVHTVNFNGVDYTECLYDDSGEYTWSEWVDKTCTCTFERYVRVPVGYDGIVLGFYDSAIEWGDGQYIFDIADENTLFFRMDGTGAEYAE